MHTRAYCPTLLVRDRVLGERSDGGVLDEALSLADCGRVDLDLIRLARVGEVDVCAA